MHYPVVFQIGPVALQAHLLFEILAYMLGYRYYTWLRAHSKDAIGDEQRIWIFLGAAAGAWLGSHLLGLLENPTQLFPFQWIRLLADKTIAGGLLGGLIGVECTKKCIGVTTSSGDLMTYPIILGICIGRVGCHLAGLTDGTHGAPTTLPWGFDYGDGVYRHPTALYEIVFLVCTALIIKQIERIKTLPNGWRFRFFMIAYLLWRLIIEGLKPVWAIPYLGISVIQLAMLLGLIYYVWLFLKGASVEGFHHGGTEKHTERH